MCGIAGYFGSGVVPRERVESTLRLMGKRGPDHAAYADIPVAGGRALLLHTRLSIIDLDPRSHQPFRDGPLSLAYNGEIYNYLEVRRALLAKGHRFGTESDTEVLLRAYLADGTACLSGLEGMWAFALFDAERQRLVLSRDRFGEKPLYYLRRPDGVYFGSEIKFLASLSGHALRPSRRQLLRYLVNGYKSLYKHGETFFEEVEELPPASVAEFGLGGGITPRRYWVPEYRPREMSLAEAIAGFRERLLRSMSLRLRGDVPMAFCLSGGVDSAALASLAAKELGYRVHAFSVIDSDERYDEGDNIRATVEDLGCRSTLIHFPRPGALERLRALVDYHDGPVATISYFVHSYLSEEMSRQGFRVSFSGTGADELVTGYYDHFLQHLHEMRGRPEYAERLAEWERWVRPVVRNPYLSRPDLYLADPGFRGHLYQDSRELSEFLVEGFQEGFSEVHYADSLLRNRMMNEMFHEGSRVILHEDDLNSMMRSVENRSPYLDTGLFEFSYAIPAEHLIRDGYAKVILREAVKGVLNERVRMDRRKKGFNASVHSILDFSDPDTRAEILGPSPVFDVVRRDRIAALLDLKPLSDNHNKFLFSFLNAKIFLEGHGVGS